MKVAIKASPLARKVAADLGIDLNQVIPSGPNNRILVADIQNFKPQVAAKPIVNDELKVDKLSNVSESLAKPNLTMPTFSETLQWESIPMNPIRKATVKAMGIANSQTALFTGLKSIDVSELVKLRNNVKTHALTKNVKLTYLAFIVKAVALSLKQMPNLNIRNDEKNHAIQMANQINIGVACDTPEGLMVPVIKCADQMSILQIAAKITKLATKARTKKLTLNEMTGGTFTISNFGSVGLDYATPIVNYPESAILGVGTITKTPAVINGEIMVRDFMPLSISCDHKVIDGADAGRFLILVTNYLTNPALLLIE